VLTVEGFLEMAKGFEKALVTFSEGLKAFMNI
jgi:hypothetical protein